MKTLLKLLIIPIILLGCEKEETPEINKTVMIDSITDIDGNVYKTVKIGKQYWMSENLRVKKFNNGKKIDAPSIENIDDSIPFCVTDSTLYYLYGTYYNWAVILDNNNVCPTGWHIPEIHEWQELINVCGGDSIAGRVLKAKGDYFWHWTSESDEKASGIDSFQFNAIGSGTWTSIRGVDSKKWSAIFPSKTRDLKYGYNRVYYIGLSNSSTKAKIYRNIFSFSNGHTIRCIKDSI